FCRHVEGFEIAGWPRPCRAPWPWAASGNPNRGGARRGPSRQGTRPGRRGRRGENPLHLVDPAEVGAADEEPRCAVAGSLPAWGVDWRLPGSLRRPLGQGRAEPVAGGDLAADGRMQADYDAWQKRDLTGSKARLKNTSAWLLRTN